MSAVDILYRATLDAVSTGEHVLGNFDAASHNGDIYKLSSFIVFADGAGIEVFVTLPVLLEMTVCVLYVVVVEHRCRCLVVVMLFLDM